jgi:FKBP-type peptidyl-prolyl cis-trans isomerase 2
MHKGDFLMIEYVGRVALTGEIFDLTDEALARKEGIHDPKQSYGPVLVIIGSGMAVPGVEKQLLDMNPGEEREFRVSQEEAFGRREPRLIKIISYHRFTSQKINPVPGIFVNIDGRHAKIQSVSGGRVRVDFNNPLAGKDLRYRLMLVRKLTSVQDRAQALLDHYGLKATAAFREGTLTIQAGERLPDQLRQLLDRQLTMWIKEIKKVDYVTKEKPGKAEEKTEPAR